MNRESIHNKTNPFLAPILKRHPLCCPTSQKNTQHVELCLEGSGINYEVGDCLAILPSQDSSVVKKILEILNLSGHETISYRENSFLASNLFSNQIDLSSPTKKLIELLAKNKRHTMLENLLADSALLKDFLSKHDVLEVLTKFEVNALDCHELSATLTPLLPRFYSIASSQKAVGKSVHLTVGLVTYEQGGNVKHGICSHYLCAQDEVEKVPIYLHPHRGFTLPADPSTPVIMIGPGTGVAPFRAFMQERMETSAQGKNWLFFGERYQSKDFLYGNYWKDLAEQGFLRLSTAFSRDQEHKIYVQHRMLEEKEDLFSWLEEGAYFYVCGDAQRMAKDVEASLLKIIEIEGKMAPEQARSYLKRLRNEKRYLRDVY